jgi:glycosyltransferase involved in cell wall biosynthesis
LGAVSDERLTELLADSHLLVAPSSYEGFGIVYIEAMRAGLPVIATTAGAAAELIDQGEQGWLIAPEDHGRLAEHLRSLAGDRRRLVRLGLAARHRALAQPNWSATTGAIERFLVELAGRWEKERP